MAKKIRSTADLRESLLETIDQVNKGKIGPAQANAIANLSGKILMSSRLDLELLRLQMKMGEGTKNGTKSISLIEAKQ